MLVVFDLDGTLTDTVGIDDACYVGALADCFGWSDRVEAYDWNQAENVSDWGILDHLCRARLNRPPNPEEQRAFERAFLKRLRDASPRAMTPVDGAPRLLEQLAESGWRVAIATGGLRAGAELKLRRAGMSAALFDGFASGSDAMPRTEIVREAVRRSGGGEAYLLVGDGRWDLATAHQLGRPFVGRAVGEGAEVLRRHGARHVLPDYSNPEVVIALFQRCLAA